MVIGKCLDTLNLKLSNGLEVAASFNENETAVLYVINTRNSDTIKIDNNYQTIFYWLSTISEILFDKNHVDKLFAYYKAYPDDITECLSRFAECWEPIEATDFKSLEEYADVCITKNYLNCYKNTSIPTSEIIDKFIKENIVDIRKEFIENLSKDDTVKIILYNGTVYKCSMIK